LAVEQLLGGGWPGTKWAESDFVDMINQRSNHPDHGHAHQI
jgi:hypothetical protein